MKKLNFLLIIAALVSFYGTEYARCSRKRRQHEHKEIVRCRLTQEDIYRGYSNNPGRYGCCERWKKCFQCGCKLEEHTKKDS